MKMVAGSVFDPVPVEGLVHDCGHAVGVEITSQELLDSAGRRQGLLEDLRVSQLEDRVEVADKK